MNFLAKCALDDFTRPEFEMFVRRIMDPRAGTEDEDSELVGHFNDLVPHPAKSDLIFWPEDGADSSPEGIVAEIGRYCRDHGLPCFRDAGSGEG